MGRSPCCAKEGLNRGAWTPSEDRILADYIKSHGEGKWRNLPKRAGLKRCGKSCRLRWLNYLRPDIKRGNITDDEQDLIIRLHKLLGNRWSLIAKRLPGRTDNEIKNFWNTNLSKKILQGGGQAISSSSTTKCKPSSTRSRSAVQNSRTNELKNPPNSENVRSCVVRTKARRFTKVFISTAELQSSDHTTHEEVGTNNIMALESPPSNINHDDKNVDPPEAPSGGAMLSPALTGEEVSGFMVDFEMDDKFLSDFFGTDFVGLEHDFDEIGVAKDTDIGSNVANDFSPNSGQSAPLHDHPEELGSMASLLDDPDMDWLHEALYN